MTTAFAVGRPEKLNLKRLALIGRGAQCQLRGCGMPINLSQIPAVRAALSPMQATLPRPGVEQQREIPCKWPGRVMARLSKRQKSIALQMFGRVRARAYPLAQYQPRIRMETQAELYDRRLNLMASSADIDAIAVVAKRQSVKTGHRVTVSDYVRAAVKQALERDGMLAA